MENMLRKAGVHVPADKCFVGTVSRRKVKANAEFARLMGMVAGDRVGTVYVESQDRWGTSDRVELFEPLGTLRSHGTRLFDLRDGKDLTEQDFATELLAVINSIKSEKELKDTAYRSLRTRVGNFKSTGSWPTGTHPFGYGKRCQAEDGTLLWVFQPDDRATGRLLHPGPGGGLIEISSRTRIPRKSRGERIYLCPGREDYVRAVRLVYELFTRVGLSRRAISGQLNRAGYTFNGGPFTHPAITNILRNPAYAGDTHFGKVQTGQLQTFTADGVVVDVKKRADVCRDPADRLVRHDTHEPLIDRKTWEQARAKLDTEHVAAKEVRKCFAPQNPAYHLKQLLVCGHCGKNLTGRTETDPGTGTKTVMYVCSTYTRGRCGKHEVGCGYHRITHADAERMLADKLEAMDAKPDHGPSEEARAVLERRLAGLGHESDEERERWWDWFREGVDDLLTFFREDCGLTPDEVSRLKELAKRFYQYGRPGPVPADSPLTLAEFRKAVRDAERAAVDLARERLATLRAEHKAVTLAWVKASDLQQRVLKEEVERLEAQICTWEPRTKPVSERFRALSEAEAERDGQRKKLWDEWASLGDRERGEALRRLFRSVTLFWDRAFPPPRTKPTRPRKTDRQGRYSYTLDRSRTGWAFTASELASFW